MTLRLNGSTSGYTEIDAPAAAGNNTLSLPTGNGTDAQVLATNGSGALSWVDRGRMVLATAQASTSGTTIDFTGIPNWARKITIVFSGVSTNGSSGFLMQIGDSGGIESTGYTSATLAAQSTAVSSAGTTNTAAFLLVNASSASYAYNGSVRLHNISGNVWVQDGLLVDTTGVRGSMSAGSKTLSDVLTRIIITSTNGGDTFDAGSINILYEG